MDIINYLVLLVCIGNLLISLFLHYNSSRSRSTLHFAIFGYSITAWCISIFFYRALDSVEDTFIWAKLLYVSASLIPSTFLIFVASFPNNEVSNRKKLTIYLWNIIFSAVILLTNTVISSVEIPQTGEKIINFGILYTYIYTIYIPATFGASFYLLYKKLNKYDPLTNTQIKYILFSTLVASSIGSATNLLMPTFGYFKFNWLGQVSTFFWLSLISYAILRYRLFDTRVLLGRIIYYILIGLIPYSFFYIFVIVYENIFGNVLHPAGFVIGILFVVFFVLVYNKANDYLQKQVTTRFINPGYDPYEVVDSLGKELATSLDTDKVAEATIKILERTIRANFHSISIVSDKEARNFGEEKEGRTGITKSNMNNLLYLWDNTKAEPILYNELYYIRSTNYNDLSHWLFPIKKEMDEKRIRAILPLTNGDKILGIIVLGSKENDNPFTQLDLELLESISSTASLAITRSLFYEEIKAFSESLQAKVDEATKSLKQQNTDLDLALNRLRKIRQQEQDMIDIMGHELRTPITLVRNALAVLQMDMKPDGQVESKKLADYLDKALRATKREMTLIETLLAATKLDANRIQLDMEEVSIENAVADTLEAFTDYAKERKLELKFTKPENLSEMSVYGDRVRYQEIIDNFTSNALKYTMKGSVEIRVHEVDLAGVPGIKVSIHDTGIGIPEEDLKKLGRKFFRARQYIKDAPDGEDAKVAGTGLGLYVSFELVRIMHGRVEVSSQVGKGSIFAFTLPKYIGQKKLHLDQTFNDEAEIEQRLKERIEKEKQWDEENIEDKVKEIKSDTKLKSEGMTKVTNANDIIAKINEGKKYLDSGNDRKT